MAEPDSGTFLDFSGTSPIADRTTAEESVASVASALERARARIDARCGTEGEWIRVGEQNRPMACGGKMITHARTDSGIAGALRGVDESVFDEAIDAVRAEVAGLGYSTESRSADSRVVMFIDPADGGFVRVMLGVAGYLTISYDTGCRPVA